MNFLSNTLAPLFLSIFLLFGCSSAPLQSSRLNSAETLIVEAEQLLARSTDTRAMKIADNKIGGARSYLSTVLDNKIYLNKRELKRYHALKQRLEAVYRRIDY